MNQFHPIAKECTVVKAWGTDEELFIEGWLSTPAKDYERDTTAPEAFLDCMDSYFERCAPLSIVHQGKTLPAGHLQKAVILRDGKVLKEALHPLDAQDFTQLPQSGDGVWIRAVVNEPNGIRTIKKGNTRGLSFMANADKFTSSPGGRYHYEHFNHWMESTIAPYPVNPTTVFQVAKAYLGLKEETMTPEEIEARIQAGIAAALEAKQAQDDAAQAFQVKKAAEEKQMIELLAANAALKTQVEELTVKVEKAMIPPRGEGAGSRASTGPTPEQEMEADPAAYAVKRAMSGEKLSLAEKDLIVELTKAAWFEGMAPA